MYWQSSDTHVPPPPPPFFKGGGVNFDYLPQRGESEKLKKGGGSVVQGKVFLKGGHWHFSKKGGKLGQGVGALKVTGGAGTPLQTMIGI